MKNKINLYQPSCYPKREKVTFKQFAVFASVCLLWLISTPFFANQGVDSAKQKMQSQESKLVAKQEQLNLLVIELKKNRAPDSKVREQLALQKDIQAKQQLMVTLSEIDIEIISFSELMKGLSMATTDAISINKFSIIDGRLNIAGYAKQGDSVPLWLSKVQTTDELMHIAFEQINISEDKQGFTFSLTNSHEKKNNNEVRK